MYNNKHQINRVLIEVALCNSNSVEVSTVTLNERTWRRNIYLMLKGYMLGLCKICI